VVDMPKRIAIVRVRGGVGVGKNPERQLKFLKLNRVNHCVIVDDSPQYMGMIAKCKDYITWGEMEKETFAMLIKKRGMASGNKRLSEENFKNSGFNSVEDFSTKFMNFECGLNAIKNIKPVFRLHPPKGGYRYIKKQYPTGALGHRGEKINELIRKMI